MARLIDDLEPDVAKKVKDSFKNDLKVFECGGCTECDECQDYIENELQNSIELVGNEDSNEDGALPPVELYRDNLEEIIEFDSTEFKKGLKEGSKVAGFITALLNAGLTNQQALDYIMNKEVIHNNAKTLDTTSKTQLKMAELQSILSEKSMI